MVRIKVMSTFRADITTRCSKCQSTDCEWFSRPDGTRGTRCLSCGHEVRSTPPPELDGCIWTSDGANIVEF